jgi:hypothetical protein
MEDLFCGWRLARLLAALIDVICLNRGTTFATVLSMLLMRHERQRNGYGVFEEVGIPAASYGAASGGAWSAEPKALWLARAKVSLSDRDSQEPRRRGRVRSCLRTARSKPVL